MPEEPLFTGSAEARPEPELPLPLDPQLRENGHYVPSQALSNAVEVALLLGQPLLLTGEPGTGKTTLAAAVARERFAGRFLEMQVKSSSTREDLLYRVDEMARFRDSQPTRRPRPLIEYFELRPLGEAVLRACHPETPLYHRSGRELRADESFLDEVFGEKRKRRIPQVQDLLPSETTLRSAERWVVLIDEIDKAPRDTPNDLLEEFERMAFAVPELELRVVPPKDAPRPVVIVTSNSEKSLPDAFLRRCAFHHIAFPDELELRRIIASRLRKLSMDDSQLKLLLGLFEKLRSRMQRRPGTAELLNWLSLADRDTGVRAALNARTMGEPLKKFISVLAKQESDINSAKSAIEEWTSS